MKKSVYFIIISVLLLSCFKKELDISLKDTDKKLVLNSLITNDSIISANLSTNLGVLETETKVKFINDAVIKLYSDDLFIQDLKFDTSGFYHADITAEIGKKYNLHVDYEGYTGINAEAMLVEPVKIKEIVNNLEITDIFIDSVFGLGIIYWQGNIELIFDDPEEENFYVISAVTLTPVYEFDEEGNELPIFEGYDLQFIWFGMDTRFAGNSAYCQIPDVEGMTLSDHIFNGNTISLKLEFWENATFAGVPIYFILYSVSKDLYKFAISYESYMASFGNPFAEPVNIYTNVENGFGLFGGYTMHTDSVLLEYE